MLLAIFDGVMEFSLLFHCGVYSCRIVGFSAEVATDEAL